MTKEKGESKKAESVEQEEVPKVKREKTAYRRQETEEKQK